MSNIILESISKRIKGDMVLEDINLRLTGGKIHGLIGRNGSGKTMLLRMLSGLIRPTGGKICYEGAFERNNAVDKNIYRIGVTIESTQFYSEFTGYDNLMFLARINKWIDPDDVKKAICDVGLYPDDSRAVRKYSMGMKQRLAIAQAIMENPDILLLDEPTNALDEKGIQLIQKLIKRQAEEGAVVVIASHSKEDVDTLCDELFMMDKGRISQLEHKTYSLSTKISAHLGGQK
jgi:ABC-2 type transport system ATP-binding protein